MDLDLNEALDGSGRGQPTQSPWPGQPGPAWPGGQPTSLWPGGQPAQQPSGPAGWPTQPSAPGGWSPQPPQQPSGPAGWPPQPSGPGGWSPQPSGPASAPQSSLRVPYSQVLPNGIYDGLVITIAGVVIATNPIKISVDLAVGHAPEADLAFHFNPRFNEHGKQVVVRNSRIRGAWGKEERALDFFPFAPGQPFEMKIACSHQGFSVNVVDVNSRRNVHLNYNHRITNLRSINKLDVYNDLTLTNVTVQ